MEGASVLNTDAGGREARTKYTTTKNIMQAKVMRSALSRRLDLDIGDIINQHQGRTKFDENFYPPRKILPGLKPRLSLGPSFAGWGFQVGVPRVQEEPLNVDKYLNCGEFERPQRVKVT